VARRGSTALTSETRKQGYRLHIDGAGDTALRAVLHPELHELFRATVGRALPHTNVYDERLRLRTRLEDEGTHLTINRFTLRQSRERAPVPRAEPAHNGSVNGVHFGV
jgi:hypothetical protein